MERDFMGLSSKEPLSVVKEEMNDDGCKDSGFTKSSVAQWSFSNKVSAIPQLMSFKVSQDDKTKKMSDPMTSAGFMTAGETKHDVKMFSVSLGNPFMRNHFATAGQNINGTTKQPMLGGIPVTVPHSSLPSIDAVAGMTESCVKPCGPSAQLTIFYAGTVNVFDDISAEKAQAIMLLAGNGLSMASNMAHPQVQAPSSMLAAGDGVPLSQPANTPPSSGRSSPLSVSSHTGAQSGSGSTSTDEFLAAKTTGVPSTPLSNVEPPKVVNAVTMLTSTVPQARRASLARFFASRKERVMNAAPYNLNKKSEECTTA